ERKAKTPRGFPKRSGLAALSGSSVLDFPFLCN
ncbi:unnamed protein product, partial [Caretta caretta]